MVKTRNQKDQSHPTPFNESKGPRIARGAMRGGSRGNYRGQEFNQRGGDFRGNYRGGRGNYGGNRNYDNQQQERRDSEH